MDILKIPQVDRHMIEATSISRPDTDWKFKDKKGHVHRWSPEGPYNPSKTYTTPTLLWVKDGVEYWDDEPHDVGHLECAKCGEHIEPGRKADDTQQYVAGLAYLTDLEVMLDMNAPDDRLLLDTCLAFFNSGEEITIFGFVGRITQIQTGQETIVTLRPTRTQDA